jgi:hypothetical protein
MKRLMWGAVLFLMVAGSVSAHVEACDWKTYATDPDSSAAIVSEGGNTVVISLDDEFVTIVVYDEGARKSNWM